MHLENESNGPSSEIVGKELLLCECVETKKSEEAKEDSAWSAELEDASKGDQQSLWSPMSDEPTL